MTRYILAIDPGDKHVGWASWLQAQEAEAGGQRKGGEWAAEEAVDNALTALVWTNLRVESTLVIEEFRLYPHKAAAQSWSQMKTAEMIGALKWMAARRGAEVVMQGANIKKPTQAQMKARGIEPEAKGRHAKDAELHLVHYMLKEELWER